MKRISFFLLVFSFFCGLGNAFAKACSFTVFGVNNEVLFHTTVDLYDEGLGQLSDVILKDAVSRKLLIQYAGSSSGISSINHLGGELEVLSDTQMNAYGWCFRVDGVIPNSMPDQYKLSGQEKSIEWFYGFAHLEKDVWTAMCSPAKQVPKSSLLFE